MEPKKLIDIFAVAERLKNNTRHCYTSSGRHESVAEHSWSAALMAMLVADEFPGADMNKVIRMCIIHDLGEAFTGDIPTFEKKDSDEKVEELLLNQWVDTLPEPQRTEFQSLLAEMKERQSLESRIYKALDNLEAVIQHNLSDISTWLPLEYDLQLTYGTENVKFSPYMQRLKEEVNDCTRRKIREESSEK